MRRRHFLGVVGATLVCAGTARGQSQTPVIGLLSSRSAQSDTPYIASLRRGLHESGAVDIGQLRFETLWAENDHSRLRGLAQQMVALNPKVIVAGGGAPPAVILKELTTSIPIVFVNGADPVQAGLVKALNRPEGNVTGVSFLATQIVAKRLGILRELLPNAERIAVLVNPINPGSATMMSDLDAARRSLRVTLLVIEAGNESEIDAAFARWARERVDALLVGSDAAFGSLRRKIISHASAQSMPTVFDNREFVSDGGLMSYGTSITEAYRQAGIYAGRLLKGERPADLPVIQSVKFELTINRKTASALGIEIPDRIIALADEVIE